MVASEAIVCVFIVGEVLLCLLNAFFNYFLLVELNSQDLKPVNEPNICFLYDLSLFKCNLLNKCSSYFSVF